LKDNKIHTKDMIIFSIKLHNKKRKEEVDETAREFFSNQMVNPK
jgi:hypothetical protein